jgi:FkbM family methyltransferase
MQPTSNEPGRDAAASEYGQATLKTLLKVVRAWAPLNVAMTATSRFALRLLGRQNEFLIKHLPRVGTVRDRLPNGRTLTLWSRGDDWVANQVYWRGWAGYEPGSSALFFRLATRSRVTLDIGAHVGFYALLAGHANPAGTVVAFEPLPFVLGRLRRNVLLNGLGNVECVGAAVGSAAGSADFYHAAVDVPCSSSLSYDFMRPTVGLARSPVRVVALDEFLAERGLCDVGLIKIDTETTEADVFRGARNLLAQARPLILCEVLPGHGVEEPLQALLGPLGYSFYLLHPDGPQPRSRIVADPVWLNYLFAPLGPDEVARL